MHIRLSPRLPATILALHLAGTAAVPLPAIMAPRDQVAELVAAEHRFAADAARIGVTPAFASTLARTASYCGRARSLRPRRFAAQTDEAGLTLEWQPAIVLVAQSGDFGVSTGPYRMRSASGVQYGQFLTIWTRDAKGRWRWFVDHGVQARAADVPPVFPPRAASFAKGVSAGRNGAAQLSVAEDALHAAIVEGGEVATLGFMAGDGRVLRSGHLPATPAEAGAMLRADAKGGSERLGFRMSGAGDLAVTYGRIARASKPRPGTYVRVWRREAAGWRVLVDQAS